MKPKRHLVLLDKPVRKGEVRRGILSRGEGALLFDETDETWMSKGKKSYVLKQFRHGRIRRTEDGKLRIRLEFDVNCEVFDLIDLGIELGDIAEYVCHYQERRKMK